MGFEVTKSIIFFIMIGVLAFASTPLLCVALLPLARRVGAMDVPKDERRMHQVPKARIGGVAVYLSFLIWGSLFLVLCPDMMSVDQSKLFWGGVVGGGVIVLGGFLDDTSGITPIGKIAWQVAAAIGGLWSIGALDGSKNDVAFSFFDGLGNANFLLISCAKIFWCVLLSNAFNLLDGLDGLCAASASFCLLTIFLFSGGNAYAVLLLMVATLGFLCLNLRPALLFLGDSGSMLLGFSLALSSLFVAEKAFNATQIFATGLTVFVPVLEAVFSASRRVIKGRNPFAPDRLHLHHRLCDAALTHAEASAIISLLIGGFCAAGFTLWQTGFSTIFFISLGILIFAFGFVIIMSVNHDTRGEKK